MALNELLFSIHKHQMKPSLIIAIVISIVSIFLASWIFLHKPSKYSLKIPSTAPKIEIKWGEGSEADVPTTVK